MHRLGRHATVGADVGDWSRHRTIEVLDHICLIAFDHFVHGNEVSVVVEGVALHFFHFGVEISHGVMLYDLVASLLLLLLIWLR